ncbi:MAG: four helix bundle protein [Bacteroidales bacterium]|nr:four helix bundle protein [Bacteroidales bacterium]
MNTYKNLEIYQIAFNLSIKIYRLNMTLPKHIFLKQGNRLRWSSVKIKDIIIEGCSNGNNEKDFVRFLTIAVTLCNEIILQLKKINTSHYGKKSVQELIINYRTLKKKIENNIENIEKRQDELALFSGLMARATQVREPAARP